MANSGLWVTSLCFYSILSIVPMFAIVFSLGTWLGVNEYFISKLRVYSPLNDDAISLLIKFSQNVIENARTGILAGIGFLFLGWTFITMFSIIEKSFNDIWKVDKTRIFLRKITDYMSFFIFFPLLTVLTTGISNLIINGFGTESLVLRCVLKVLPFLAILLFFTILYMLIPNTKVKVIPALMAAIFITIIFSGSQKFFILLQGMINTYNTIYGSFSVVFIFLFWLRIIWFFIILGVHICYFLQNIELHLFQNNISEVNFKSKKIAGIIILRELIDRYQKDIKPITINELVIKYDIPYEIVQCVFDIFIYENIVGEVRIEDGVGYTIIKNIERLEYKTVISAMENYGDDYNYSNCQEILDCIEKLENKKIKFKDMLGEESK